MPNRTAWLDALNGRAFIISEGVTFSTTINLDCPADSDWIEFAFDHYREMFVIEAVFEEITPVSELRP